MNLGKSRNLLPKAILLAALVGLSTQAHANSGMMDSNCREYSRTIYVGGQAKQGYGTACLQADGSWQIISGDTVGQTIAPTYIIQQPQPIVYYARPGFGHHSSYYQPHHYGTSMYISLGDNRHHWRGKRGHDWRGHGHSGCRHDHRHSRSSGNRISWR